MTNDHVPNSKEESVCQYCSCEYQCSKLRGALEILNQQIQKTNDPHAKQIYNKIIEILKEDRWNYPDSKQYCNLKDQPGKVNALVHHAIKVLRDAFKFTNLKHKTWGSK